MSKKYQYYMGIAEAVATASHDSETKVGAVLIKNDTGALIASGFNGFVRKAPDNQLPTTRPEKYEYMIHAEANLIAHCARHGISMDNCTIYSTLSPCINCARLLWQCGLTNVIAKTRYKDLDLLKTAIDLKVTVTVDENTQFTVITYG